VNLFILFDILWFLYDDNALIESLSFVVCRPFVFIPAVYYIVVVDGGTKSCTSLHYGARISISCRFKKLFMIENTLKIIIPSLFKAKI